MRRSLLWLMLVLLALAGAPSAFAQDTSPAGQNSVEILWPPPVSEVWSSGDVIGTAAVPGMSYYYLEYLPLNDDLSMPDNAPWIPATIGIEKPVINGVLATLDTTLVTDGLYALRLVVNTREGQSYTDTVSPIRVNNERMTAYTERVIDEALVAAGVKPPTEVEPTQPPQPTPVTPSEPTLTPAAGLGSINIRRCDLVDNYRCSVLGYLSAGENARVLAKSSNGTGWFQIQTPSGLIGWVSPTVAAVSGNTDGLPVVAPPAPLPPPVIDPTAVPSNVVPNGLAIVGGTAICNQPFTVQVNIANVGGTIAAPGSVSLQDVNVRTGEVTYSTSAAYPAINPGGNFVASFTVLVSVYFNEQHELRAYSGGQVFTLRYSLGQGSCGNPPQPTTVPKPPTTEFGPNQCFVVNTVDGKAIFNAPEGNIAGKLTPGPYEALRGQFVNGNAWYQINAPGIGPAWVASVETQGGCSI